MLGPTVSSRPKLDRLRHLIAPCTGVGETGQLNVSSKVIAVVACGRCMPGEKSKADNPSFAACLDTSYDGEVVMFWCTLWAAFL